MTIQEDKGGLVQIVAIWLLPICIIIRLLPVDLHDVGLYAGCPWWHALTFHLFHGGWFHMFINCYALIGVTPLCPYKIKDVIILLVLVSCYPFAGTETIVGLSGLIYAMFGMLTVHYKFNMNVLISISLSLAIGVVIPHVAWGVHLWSYVMGIAYGIGESKDI